MLHGSNNIGRIRKHNEYSLCSVPTMTEPAVSHHDVVVAQHRISYAETGAGQAVRILVHGLGGCWRHWAPTLTALAPHGRTIALDLPGFGRSEHSGDMTVGAIVEVIDAVRTSVGADRVDLVGHSMGTLLTCEYAARRPEMVRRMVLVGGPILSVIELFRSPAVTLFRNPQLANFLIEAATVGIPLPNWAVDLVVSNRWARRLALSPYTPDPGSLSPAAVRDILAGSGGSGTLATLRQGFGYDFRPALAALSCPTMVIGGREDRIAPEGDLRRFARLARCVESVEILPGTGHLAMIERPESVNPLIESFLNAQSPTSEDSVKP
ncbi:alpha/beta fold hydrolase [Nocardia sp. NPDC058058]|uniref:alpha/beta fold hydrolase n=1 Tax=Nocardia sp. NPDC058058 TaxID=3346317 RepID=UPI0036DAA820